MECSKYLKLPLLSCRVVSDQTCNGPLITSSEGVDDHEDAWALLSSLNSISQKYKLVALRFNGSMLHFGFNRTHHHASMIINADSMADQEWLQL